MADSNILKRFLDAGVAFTELTQARAEAIVKDLVAAGEVQTNQAQAAVAELLQRSRENTERLIDQVQGDIRSQLDSMGLATKLDISRLERLISSIGGRRSGAEEAPSTPAMPPASAPSTRAPVTASVKTAPAKRPAAKKTPTPAAAKKAAKAPAVKAPAVKKATKRSPAKAAAKKR